MPGRIKNIVLLLLTVLLNSLHVKGQDSVLTLQQAIEVTLENNYQIRIAGNTSKQQDNNNSLGNAGMLPEVNANASYTKSENSLKQKYNNGSEVNRDAAEATGTSLDIGVTWTIFDGLKMFSTKQKLSELSLQSRDMLL